MSFGLWRKRFRVEGLGYCLGFRVNIWLRLFSASLLLDIEFWKGTSTQANPKAQNSPKT